MKSVQTKMVGLVVTSLVIALGIYSTLLYINLKKIIVTNQEEHLSRLAVASSSDIALWLDGKKREMSAIADSFSLEGDDKPSISTRLKIHAKSNPTYEMVFYADTSGEAITSSDFKANIVDRAYFRQVLHTGKEVVSDPVISRASRSPVVVIAAPVKKGSLITGIFGCTISLDYLSQLISNITSMGTGYGFVVQGDGTTIIHPDSDLVLKHNILKDPQMDPSLKGAVSKMIRQKEGLATYVYKGVAKYLAFAPVPGSNWSLGINAPVGEVLGQLSPINKLIIITPVFVIILASALISLSLVMSIVRPITSLRNMMSRVEAGDLDVRADYGSSDEIAQLTGSFNRMVQTIKYGREKILQSEEKYRSLFEKAAIGFFRTTQDGKVLSANPSLASVLGFDSPQEYMEAVNNMGSQHFANPDDRETLRKILETEGGVEGFETRLLRKDGASIWASLNVRAVGDDKGSVLHYDGTVVDITRSKQAEQSLKQSERRLSNIIEFLPDATFAIDRDGCVIAWNRAIEEMTGYTKEMMLGKGNYEYAIPFYGDRRPILVDFLSSWDDDVAKRYSYIKRNGDKLYTETEVPRVRGERRVLWGKASPLRDEHGEITGAIESIRDITDQKQIEKALRESEEKHRLLFESATEGILIAQGIMLKFVNPAFEDIMGYPGDVLLSQPFTSFIHPDDRDMVSERHIRRMEGEDVPTGYSFRIITAQGEERWIEIKSIPISWEGKLSNLSFVIDITERKRSEEEREKLKDHLTRAQKLESIGTLAGGIAHDFNNLLMGILGHSSLMMHDIDPSHPHHIRLKHIEEQVASGARLTKQLL
ncbi:MAG: PAS domain S-box protein, partial [Deltaproteobacteria bacterium]|nr:PAS domain S-box protein [Deltaproteobacteria bacterium]